MWSVAVNILNKQWRTTDKGWCSSLVVERGANNSSHLSSELPVSCERGNEPSGCIEVWVFVE
jgi:hypothetical protein